MDSEDASEATEVTTARGRRRRGEEGAREMIVPEKKMMLPPPSPHFKRAGRAAKWVGVPGIAR